MSMCYPPQNPPWNHTGVVDVYIWTCVYEYMSPYIYIYMYPSMPLVSISSLCKSFQLQGGACVHTSQMALEVFAAKTPAACLHYKNLIKSLYSPYIIPI